MNHRVVLGLILAGSVGVMIYAVNRSRIEPDDAAVVPIVHERERPWLAGDKLDELIADAGVPGPLFADVTLGGPAPSAAARERIERYAHDNDVEIQLDTHGDKLVAIRFAVTFGGCCGYEGADKLGRRLGRPWTEDGCPAPKVYMNTWSYAASDKIETRANVDINRVTVRWEAIPTFAQLLDRAESLIGQNQQVVGEANGDHWRRLETDHLYLLEVPYPFGVRDTVLFSVPPKLIERDDLGFRVTVENSVVTGVKFTFRQLEDFEGLRDALEKRWGPATKKVEGETSAETWRWKKKGRAVVATPDSAVRIVEITKV